MKKIFKLFILLFICMILLTPLNMSSVLAAEKEQTVISYHQAIVKEADRSEISGFTAVSQYYYTIRNKIGTEEATIAREVGEYINLTSVGKCSNIFGTGSYYCTTKKEATNDGGNQIVPAYASISITNHGDIGVYLANGVTLTRMRVYFIIANKSNNAQLFCDSSGTICEEANKISKREYGAANWKSELKSGGTMSFNSNNITQYFEQRIIGENKENLTGTGAKEYYGFNIVDKMNTTLADLARKYGIYVITSLSITYQGNNYYINEHIDDHTFSEVGNFSSNSWNNFNACSADKITNIYGCMSHPAAVANIGVLVRPLEGEEVADNKAYNDFMQFLDTTGVPVLKIVIILLFLVVGTVTIIKIVKSSDEPQERSTAIKKLIAMFVGSVIIYMILIFYKEVIDAVSGWFM